jgi:hypothetical protein
LAVDNDSVSRRVQHFDKAMLGRPLCFAPCLRVNL